MRYDRNGLILIVVLLLCFCYSLNWTAKLYVIFKNLETHHPVIQALKSHDEAVWGSFTPGTPAWLIQKYFLLTIVVWLCGITMAATVTHGQPRKPGMYIPEQTQAWEEGRRKYHEQTVWAHFYKIVKSRGRRKHHHHQIYVPWGS